MSQMDIRFAGSIGNDGLLVSSNSSIFYLLIRFIRCHRIRGQSLKLTCWMVGCWSFTFPRNVWFWRTFSRASKWASKRPTVQTEQTATERKWITWNTAAHVKKRKYRTNEERKRKKNRDKKMNGKLFVTQHLLAPKSDKLFRKICSLQVRLPTFCFAYQRNVAIFVNNHVCAGVFVTDIRRHWKYSWK